MNNELQDILAVAAAEKGRGSGNDAPPRRTTQLHAVAARQASPSVTPTLPIAPSAPASQVCDDPGQLGRRGLRLGFWLCGFHNALIERQKCGEILTEREVSLLELSRRDFSDIRPLVVAMAIERLHAVVCSPSVIEVAGPVDGHSSGPMEAFALETLRNLANRAQALLKEQGPDAAMSMFGVGADLTEPLAIFQAVFATALGMIEAFDPLIPGGARALRHITAALDSELDRT